MSRPQGSTNIPWGQLVTAARRRPGSWTFPPELIGVPFRTVAVIRRRERPALRLEDGTINVRRLHTTQLQDGKIICTLAIKFDPKKEAPRG